MLNKHSVNDQMAKWLRALFMRKRLPQLLLRVTKSLQIGQLDIYVHHKPMF